MCAHKASDPSVISPSGAKLEVDAPINGGRHSNGRRAGRWGGRWEGRREGVGGEDGGGDTAPPSEVHYFPPECVLGRQ